MLILVRPERPRAEQALFPLENPGIVSIPLGFLAAVVGNTLSREPEAESRHAELLVRAITGLGAETSAPR